MGADGRLQICLDSPSFYTAVEANLAVTLRAWAAHLLCPPDPTSGAVFHWGDHTSYKQHANSNTVGDH